MEIRLTRDHLKGSDLYHRWEEIKQSYIKNEGISAILQEIICDRFYIDKLSSEKRESNYVRARQIYCTLVKILTKKSIKEIGKSVCRDHSSIVASMKKFNTHYAIEKDYREDVHSIAIKLDVISQEKIYNYLKTIKNKKQLCQSQIKT